VSLDGSSSEVKVTKLMKNDDEYFAVSDSNPCTCSCIMLCTKCVSPHLLQSTSRSTRLCTSEHQSVSRVGSLRLAHDVQVELPRVSPLYKGRKYRYAYAGTAKLPTTVVNSLSKLDVEAGTSKMWFEQGALPTGELQPVPLRSLPVYGPTVQRSTDLQGSRGRSVWHTCSAETVRVHFSPAASALVQTTR